MKRNPQPDLALVPQIDWARLAAYIDGEGNIDIAFQATCVRCGVKGTPDAVLEQRAGLKAKLRALTARGSQQAAVNA